MTKSTETYADRGFSKHITKIVVVLMILLMAFSFNFGGRARQLAAGEGVTIGVTRDGTRVSSVDRQYAARLLDTLDLVSIRLRDQQAPLAYACWGPEIAAGFKKNPEALWLALQEARRNGPGASQLTLGPLDADERSTQDFGIFNSGLIWIDQLHPLPTSPLGSLPPQARGQSPISILAASEDRRVPAGPVTALAPLEQDDLYRALRDFLSIQSAASLTTSALKVSTPTVDRFIAERFQQFTASVARVDASAFAGQVGEPTDAQVAEQFARFAAFEPNRPTADDPFGFGYRVGDRVAVEWIALDRAAIRGIVEAERTPYQWEVDARIAYAKDPMTFASLAPATQATTAPTTAAATTGFDSVKSAAITLFITRAADARLNEIERRIRSTLTSDYQAYSVAQTTHAATQPTSVKLAIDDAGYLDAIAADVGRKFKIAPPKVVHLTDALRDRDALAAASPAFASLALEAPFDASRPTESASDPAPAYALHTAAAASTQPSAEAARALALFQPSETVSNPTGNALAIFRVTAAASSAPGMDALTVRPRVVADWKAQQAQTLALKSATASADAVRAGTLAVYNVPGAPGASVTIGPLAQSPAPPPALALSATEFAQFFRAFSAALLTDDAAGGQPVAAIDVPLARRVYVVQRTGLRAAWTTADELARLRDHYRDEMSVAMSLPGDASTNAFALTSYTIGNAFLNVDRIFERAGWTANHGN